jgi:UDP-glucose 4-epimerase
MVKNERILLTGGVGFIGTSIYKHLVSNYDIDVVDLKKDKLDRNNFYQEDISTSTLDSLNNDYKYVIHAAAQSGGYRSLQDPLEDCDWNCRATANLVNFCKKNKNLEKIIFLSSMAVYGEGRNKKEDSRLEPISFYGVSKLASENYVKLIQNHCDVSYTIFRLWNTYGGGQDLNNLNQGMLSIYLSQALSSNTIKIKGSKDRVRDFIHVSDVVSAIELSLVSKETDNQIFNLCTNKETSTADLISLISKKINKQVNIEIVEGYVGDQINSSGTAKKIMRLGWKPKVSLENGIEEFLSFVEAAK